MLVTDIVSSLYTQGLRNFVVLSGHAGGTHNAALLDAGEELLTKLPEARIAVVTEYQLAFEKGKDLIETKNDSHAGEIETSRMLATRPHLVKSVGKEDAPCFPKHILVRNKFHYWESGVWGDPEKADPEKGAAIESCVVEALNDLVTELESFVEPEI
jgi:creatinine amidohydrolase